MCCPFYKQTEDILCGAYCDIVQIVSSSFDKSKTLPYPVLKSVIELLNQENLIEKRVEEKERNALTLINMGGKRINYIDTEKLVRINGLNLYTFIDRMIG